ncbi:MAG: DUF1489 family protein [Acidimicrobiales bacterium]|nr:DUF1489 domain-containing protein [Hyphomonadaceae bacterium]RZV44954.1 MAG: DUF1489 family protein [Acidimicrobiales bacterium]
MANSTDDSTLIHLQKLSVGTESIETLADWQKRLRIRRGNEGLAAYPDHITRMMPKQRKALLNGGSVYWVIKGIIQCRNPILDLQEMRTNDGRKACRIVLDPELVPVVPMPRRAFQGWRYLSSDDAPKDLSSLGEAGNLPASLRTKLVDLGAW